jgi:hypothetical protein
MTPGGSRRSRRGIFVVLSGRIAYGQLREHELLRVGRVAMRLRLQSALVLAGMARAFVPHEAVAAPVRVVAPPMSGIQDV